MFAGILDNLLKHGTSIVSPTYKPKKIDRTLENNMVNENFYYDNDQIIKSKYVKTQPNYLIGDSVMLKNL